jgi:hypothetical protein
MEERENVNMLQGFEDKTYAIAMEVQRKIGTNSYPDARVSCFYKMAQILRSYKIYPGEYRKLNSQRDQHQQSKEATDPHSKSRPSV